MDSWYLLRLDGPAAETVVYVCIPGSASGVVLRPDCESASKVGDTAPLVTGVSSSRSTSTSMAVPPLCCRARLPGVGGVRPPRELDDWLLPIFFHRSLS